ncbi:IS110 family transposase [Paraburkholderia sp. USG1]|uniref:IS110 family transposase n=1 Tax=Paraburkholderia sp. USG1 TaxID=2952268 RepID=UPI00285832DA|nr:IS110 family transposase [Paraburkholderia sp. USG1]MDR8397931.1 IS110 family transposase [Paraburkholderia sp. USG1]
MANATLVGIDLGKHCFFLHAQDAHGHEVWRKKATRTQLYTLMANCAACTVAMEACAGAHWLARKFQGFGHQVRLIAPQFVKPFVKGNKTDFADAEAICEAASRPSMRFVAIKTPEQQTLLALHRMREALVRERTATGNQIHAFLLEFGVSLPIGSVAITRLPILLDDPAHALPPPMVALLLRLYHRFGQLSNEIVELETELKRQLAGNEAGQRLLTIPGIGPMTASSLLAMAGDVHGFRRGRDFAASLGLVPRQHSTGGRATLLGISKRGDKHLRSLLVQGARAVLRCVQRRTDALGAWVQDLLRRRHTNVVACALANKMARIVWAILARGGEYQAHPRPA